MSLSANKAGWKIILWHLEMRAWLNRPKGSKGPGFLSERNVWEAFEILDPALLVRERTVRGVIVKKLKEAGWTADRLEAAGIKTYLWHPPKEEER